MHAGVFFNKHTLQEVEPAVFEAVLEFCYAGDCTFDESLSLAMLHAALRLGIKPLETSRRRHLAPARG